MPFATLQGESLEITLQFALLLRDGFADSDQLLGDVTVAAGAIDGQQKDSSGAFLFYNFAIARHLLGSIKHTGLINRQSDEHN